MPTFGRTARLRPLAAFDSRLLALLDAVVWPGLIAAMVGSLSIQSGIVGTLTLALCVLFGVRRCVRALWHNERYQFTPGVAA